MRRFWTAGYEATSTSDLSAATGLGRSSIYNAFASKHELFERALVRYMEQKTAAAIELLEREDIGVRERLRALLRQAVEPDADDPVGCLVVNTSIELGPRDEAVARLLRHDHARRTAALRRALEQGRRTGEIAPDKDPRALAEFVVAAIAGIRVAARSGADRGTLESIAAVALTAL